MKNLPIFHLANGVADGSYEITINLSDPDFNSPSQNFVFSIFNLDELPLIQIPLDTQ